MATVRCIVFLTTLLAVVVADDILPDSVSVTLDISQSTAHVGDNVTLTCRTHETSEDQSVAFFKNVILEGEIEAFDMITAGSEKLPPYTKLGRYHVQKVDTGSSVLYILNIYGVQTVDSGHIGCTIGQLAENRYDTEQFDVYQNAMALQFVNWTAEGHITVTEGVSTPLVCEIVDVRPMPQVTMLKGDDDVTSSFMQKRKVNVMSAGDVTKDEPLHYSYTVEMTNHMFTATYEDHGKQMACSYQLPGSDMEMVSHEVALNVLYDAKFVCDREVTARYGDASVQISCNISANPHSENATYAWRFMHGSSEQFLRTGFALGMYSTGAERLDDQVVRVSLTIFNVMPECFIDYTIVTDDLLGNATYTIALVEDTSIPMESGAPVTMSYTSLVAILTLGSAVLRLRAH